MRVIKYISCLLLILLLLNCNVQNGTTPTDNEVEALVKDAWEEFEAGNYSLASDKFEEAFAKDNGYAEAYNGAGWSRSRLTDLPNSVSYFTECIDLNSSLVDAHAGLAFVYNAQKFYQSTITSAKKALSISSNWQFSHDQTISYTDLYLILAASYFALGDFSQSLTYVKKLNPSFAANVATYEGKSKLAEEIERLRGIV